MVMVGPFWAGVKTMEEARKSQPQWGHQGKVEYRPKYALIGGFVQMYAAPSSRVLDVCCGYPYWLVGFQRLQYVGVDFCEESLGSAREDFPGAGFYVADFMEWGSGETFDVVVWAGIELAMEPRRMLDKILSCHLGGGGLFVCESNLPLALLLGTEGLGWVAACELHLYAEYGHRHFEVRRKV